MTRAIIPYIKTVEVEICPFLSLPPMMPFPLKGLLCHSNRWRGLGNCLQEDGTPANGVLLLTEKGGQVEL